MSPRRVTFEPTQHFAADWRVVGAQAVMVNGRLIGRVWAILERADLEPEWRYKGVRPGVAGRGLASSEKAIEALLSASKKI